MQNIVSEGSIFGSRINRMMRILRDIAVDTQTDHFLT
jgi:hypothetical protein